MAGKRKRIAERLPDSSFASVNHTFWTRWDISDTRCGRAVLWLCAPKRWASVPTPDLWPFLARQVLDAEAERRGEVADFTPEHDDERQTAMYDQYAVRRIQQARLLRHYQLSRQLERKRFPVIPRIKKKLLPKQPGRMLGCGSVLEYKNRRRAELNLLVAAYLSRGGVATYCPAEWTTRMLQAMLPQRVGRPPIAEQAQTNAERQKRYRDRKRNERLRVITEEVPIAPPLPSPPPTGEQHGPRITERTHENVESLEPPHAEPKTK